MRLAFICENGKTLDIGAALQLDPYVVRWLVADALFQCQQRISDTLDLIHVERAVRDALLAFQGGQDRYARSYVHTRTLDHRTQTTPRADLINLAFHHGGPLALVGIFYATSDAHRNPGSREVLDYIMNKASHESQLQLISRVSTFPCNPSVSDWLCRILDKLDASSQNLASMLRYLGTSRIPMVVFRRMWEHSLSWDENGEAIATSLPTNTIGSRAEFAAALRHLQHVGFVRVSGETIDLDSRISELLRARLEQTEWIAEAVRIMAHSFPKYRQLEPTRYGDIARRTITLLIWHSYVEHCERLQPLLESVFSHIDSLQLGTLVDQSCLMQLVDVCLSASYLCNKSWKITAISVAARALKEARESPYSAVLEARIHIRKSSLIYLYEETTSTVEHITFPVNDHRSKAFSADLAMLKAQGCVHLNALASAMEYLAGFNPSWNGVVSSFGAAQEKKVAFMRARILRFEGRFQEAYELVRSLPSTGNKTVSLLGILLCELHRCDEGIELLNDQVTRMTRAGRVKRVRIALGYAYLIKSMQNSIRGLPLDWRSLHMARKVFQELSAPHAVTTYYDKMDHLSLLFGLAIVDHMNGNVDSALAAWEMALGTSQEYLDTGYTDLVISYSISELEARRGATTKSTTLGDYARTLFVRTGRQHHFAGLGSLWLDLIGKWLIAHGREAIIPS
ncbi:hypothetical protein F5Y13DRAFT_204303 [Hypoxylon sp. FL1857]|nr:hypothetical protein F5Y13DRAFT_204303 [Hypoxylon sp. FL1857]